MQFQVPTGLRDHLDTYLKENKTIDLVLVRRTKNINGKLTSYERIETFESKRLIKFLPYVYYLTDLYYSRKRNPRNFGKDWMNFKWDLLVKVIPVKTYRKVKAMAEKLEVFDINETYLPPKYDFKNDGFTKSFRLTDKYIYSKSEYIEVNTKLAENIGKKAERIPDKRFADMVSRVEFPEYKYLCKSFLEVSTDKRVYDYIRYALKNKIELKDKQKKTKEGYYITIKDRHYNQDSYNSDIRSLHLLGDRVYNPSLSAVNNRLSTTFTSLRSDLRPFLKVNGRSLVSLDISSSQVIQLIAKLKKDIEKLSSKLKVNKEVLEAEINHLSTLCQSGKLYHIISEKCCESGLLISKDEGKTMFFSKFMYCQNSTSSKFKKVIQSIFPVIVEAVHYYKRKDFKFLSNDLTTQESQLVLNRIVRRVAEEYKNSVMITVHDACLVDINHVDVVYNIMMETIEACTGIVANIKVEDLQEEYEKIVEEISIDSGIDSRLEKDFENIPDQIGDYDSDEETIEDSILVPTFISAKPKLDIRIEKKVKRLKEIINTPYDPEDYFDVMAYELAVSQLEEIRKEMEVVQ